MLSVCKSPKMKSLTYDKYLLTSLSKGSSSQKRVFEWCYEQEGRVSVQVKRSLQEANPISNPKLRAYIS